MLPHSHHKLDSTACTRISWGAWADTTTATINLNTDTNKGVIGAGLGRDEDGAEAEEGVDSMWEFGRGGLAPQNEITNSLGTLLRRGGI